MNIFRSIVSSRVKQLVTARHTKQTTSVWRPIAHWTKHYEMQSPTAAWRNAPSSSRSRRLNHPLKLLEKQNQRVYDHFRFHPVLDSRSGGRTAVLIEQPRPDLDRTIVSRRWRRCRWWRWWRRWWCYTWNMFVWVCLILCFLVRFFFCWPINTNRLIGFEVG